ncbi:hypothetical protein QMT40_001820 [Parvibaculaceae bacterium PLY_AMNH_Bact1]|nr:hypothetical protein QMT40_001820 [Parvibaculaceae bacterium PLY_AMNH_Bact1]
MNEKRMKRLEDIRLKVWLADQALQRGEAEVSRIRLSEASDIIEEARQAELTGDDE